MNRRSAVAMPARRRAASPGTAQRQPAARAAHREAIDAAVAHSSRLAQAAAHHTEALLAAIELAASALRRGNQVLFCGNGGSAAQAAHLAAELSGRFYLERDPLRAQALTENVPALTAVANDYGYEFVFARQLLALARSGDVLVALSTSGGSPNILRAIETARRIGIKTIGLTGERGTRFASACDVGFVVPAADTARIQEIHLLLGHIICARIEAELCAPTPSRSRRSKP